MTASAAGTERAGARLGRRLARGDLLLLVGELGAGKTTFVRGLARGMRLGAHVTSPTFQLVRVYPGATQLAHADLYRLRQAGELEDLGLEDLLDQGALVVEWGERLGMPDACRVVIEVLGPSRRRLRLEGGEATWSW